MKITELTKRQEAYKGKLANPARSTTIADASIFQEINFRLCVSETLLGYYTIASKVKGNASAEGTLAANDEKAIKTAYMCLAKYASALPGAFCFWSSNDAEKEKAQKEANENLTKVCVTVSKNAKEIKVSTKEEYLGVISNDCVAITRAFDALRDTILKI